jgi:hypothetical protein
MTWSERLGGSDEKFKGRVYVPNIYSRLYCKHFEESAFEKSPSVLRSVGCGDVFRPQLKRDALPSIFEHQRSEKKIQSAQSIASKRRKIEVSILK